MSKKTISLIGFLQFIKNRNKGSFKRLFFLAMVGSFVFAYSPVRSEEKNEKPKRSWRDFFKGSSRKKETEGDSGSSFRRKKEISDSGELSEESNPEGMVDLVDAPTTNIIDYGGYRLNFRLYSGGGLVSHLSFGVFRRLNIGASWDNEKVIGTEDPTTNSPTLNIKLRAYDGSRILPSLAIGYDGQGRFFNKATDQYTERERGLYLAFEREFFFPRLEFYGGTNIAKFKEGEVYGFVGASYLIEQKIALIMEYDNIRVGPRNRWNAGIRVFPISSLAIDFAVRKIGSIEDKERIVRINYVGSF